MPLLLPIYLKLKINIFIIYLHNIQPNQGLYNKSKIIVINIKQYILKIIILKEKFYNTIKYFLYILFKTKKKKLLFILKYL